MVNRMKPYQNSFPTGTLYAPVESLSMGAQVRPLFGRKALHEPRDGEETLTKQPRTLERHQFADCGLLLGVFSFW